MIKFSTHWLLKMFIIIIIIIIIITWYRKPRVRP
jgi:hypothetical protein